jgi:PhzF family phenazine biosynthesis protein
MKRTIQALRLMLLCFLPIVSSLHASDNHLGHVVHIVNAFTKEDQGGNPSAIVLGADDLSKEEMQTLATQIGNLVLEKMTVFIVQPEDSKNDYKLLFFTPVRQIPHCGHATIAAFNYLTQNGSEKKAVLTKETIDGTRQVVIQCHKTFLEQSVPTYKNPNISLEELNQVLQTPVQEFMTEPQPGIFDTGNQFLIIGVKSTMALGNIKPNLPLIKEISERLGLVAFYVFAIGNNDVDATARMFEPRYGIDEESASGTAAGALACYLYDQCNFKKGHFKIEQGRFMPQPSIRYLYVNLKLINQKIENFQVGGTARYVKHRKLYL